MNAAMRKGFLDELQKIGGVNLHGLSPETLLTQKPPEPMETLGVQRAFQVLDRAEAMKTANMQSPAMQLRTSQMTGKPNLSQAKSGPGFKQQLRGSIIGQKGALPPVG